MKTHHALATMSLVLAASAAAAQPAPAPAANFALPRAYSGYAQPEITSCTTVGTLKRDCIIPAMTAGRYLIVAVGAATASGANATQSLSISLNGAPCVGANPTPFTAKQGLRLACEVSILTDQPITATASYAVQNGVPDQAGPQLVLRRLPWFGVVSAHPVVLQAPKAAAKK
jgi:hypothetical protein